MRSHFSILFFSILICAAVSSGQQTPQPPQLPPQSPQDPGVQEPSAPDETQPDSTQAEYAGPAILSRGDVVGNFGLPRSLRFRPYLAVNGIYDHGVTPVSVTPTGTIPQFSGYGLEAIAGITGVRNSARTSVSLALQLLYRDYSGGSYFNGLDGSLNLMVNHRLGKRFSVSWRESGTTYSRSFGVRDSTALAPAFVNFNNPANEIFDGRTYFVGSGVDVIYQKSARMSFDFGGIQELVRRHSFALYDATGYGAHTDMSYRVGRRVTLGLYYRFNHFAFNKQFGASDIHTLGANVSRRLSRYWDLGLSAGASRVETLGLTRVAVDPVIAAITGQSFGVRSAYTLVYAPDFSARLSRTFHLASLAFVYSRSITPGNGLYLTSQGETASVSYSYSGLQRWSFVSDVAYNKYISVSQTIGNYVEYHAGVGLSRTFHKAFSFIARATYRTYNADNNSLHRKQYDISIGLAYSPGERPVSLW